MLECRVSGERFCHLSRAGGFSDGGCKLHIIFAIEYLHGLTTIYRELKPEKWSNTTLHQRQMISRDGFVEIELSCKVIPLYTGDRFAPNMCTHYMGHFVRFVVYARSLSLNKVPFCQTRVLTYGASAFKVHTS